MTMDTQRRHLAPCTQVVSEPARFASAGSFFIGAARTLAAEQGDLRGGGKLSDPSGLTVIVPAYNEAGSIGETVTSLLEQSVPPDEIIVVDDCSTDDTGDVARSHGVTVIRPPANTGSKAGAQTFALERVRTEYVMAVDADTTLERDAIEKLLPVVREPGVAAACGFVLPRRVRSMWERGRYVEYLVAFTWYKPIQDYYEKPMISSGCFSAYRTEVIREAGAWTNDTLAEDVDLTWRLYSEGHGVRFVAEAVGYPIEPRSFSFMRKQLKRWSHGFVQNVRLHWERVLETSYLRSMVAVAFWDAVLASIAYLLLLPILAIAFGNPLFLLGYVIDIPAVLVPVVAASRSRGEVRQAVASLPAFFVLRTVNAVFMLWAIWRELILRRSFRVYEKGH
jgi:cellulose synthase/poly-beta-1,6-N-acetylglucosamine synthase-like glycosyltransferase